jgi:PAS domain S-box-containing protein
MERDLLKKPASFKKPRQINILLVDDRPENLMALDVVLNSEEYRLLHAASGPEALEILKSEECALVLLDVQMPIMDGFETAKKIQELGLLKIPIIFVTAIDSDFRHIEAAYTAGAVDFITKPIDGKALAAKVNVFVQLYKQTKLISEQSELLRTSSLKERALLLDNALDAVVGVDQNDLIVDWNRQAEVTFGWTRDEVVGTSMASKIIPQSFRERHLNGLKHFLKTGEGPILNKRIQIAALHRNGQAFPVELTVIPIFGNGRYLFYSFLRDITAQKEAEAEKERLRRNLVFLSESTKTLLDAPLELEIRLDKFAQMIVPEIADWCGIDLVESDGTIKQVAVAHVDPAKVELARELRKRYPERADAPLGVPKVIRTGKSELLSEIPDEILRANVRDPDHYQIITELGLRSYMCVPLKSRDRIIGALSLVSAESGKRFTPDDLEVAEEIGRRAASAIENAVLYQKSERAEQDQRFRAELSQRLSHCATSEDVILEATSALAKYLNVSRCWMSEVEDESGIATVYQDVAIEVPSIKGTYDLNSFGPLMVKSWREDAVVTVSDVNLDPRTKDHSRPHLDRRIRSFITAAIVRKGKLVGALNVAASATTVWAQREVELVRLISEATWAAFESAKLLAALRSALKARDEFLSIASHELRTPITSLQLTMQILARQIDKGVKAALTPEHIQEVTRLSQKQITQLVRLMDDMLDVSTVESGRMHFNFEHCDLREVVRTAIDVCSPQFAVRDVRLRVDMDAILFVRGDFKRLTQVVTNLLTNSLKYGSEKPVTLSVSGDENSAYVKVEDQGIGIESEHIGRIFDRYERAISANDVSGLGLGLYIGNQIVVAHHGRIEVKSEIGRGTTFTVVLPLET